ncbi:RNA-guided endonuclease InsQ/TnpB family protein [Nonomuraea fuscirosea]|uniref:RNA-guided endonuclease InsQ/TnpB family protein n=1 Tax=Nonomuraea fuscirosea TaxID=1291556 RepID=UPI003795927B
MPRQASAAAMSRRGTDGHKAVTVRRSFTFLLRPTSKQAAALAACPEDHRTLYNAALEHRRTAYAKAGVSVRYGDQSAELNQHRPVRGGVKTISVKREGRRWYVVLSCDEVPAEPLPRAGAVAGIDMGLAWLVTTRDGVHVANPRHLVASADRLAAAQRDLAAKKRGSRRRRKAVASLAALHAKARRQRLDTAHKAALALVREYDMIVHEDLRIANMTRSASGTIAAPGRNVAAKAGLDRSILDAGWGVFLTILARKAESAGRELIAVNPAGTSRTCARCGHCAKENRLTQASFACTACGHAAHADVNAAINILRAGLALRNAAQAA